MFNLRILNEKDRVSKFLNRDSTNFTAISKVKKSQVYQTIKYLASTLLSGKPTL